MVLNVRNNEVEPNNHNPNVKRKGYHVVLTIAGSDSSGGAGIQADIKTFAALGVYGAAAITAITAQNTLGVHSQFSIAPHMVYDQIIAVMDDLSPSVIKIGMLSNAEIVVAVAEALSQYSIPIILDPVIVSTSGHRLLSAEAEKIIKDNELYLGISYNEDIVLDERLSAEAKNELMSITTMIDEFGRVGVVIFPSLYKQISSLLNPGCYLVVEGKVEVKENVSIVANNIKEFQIKANG